VVSSLGSGESSFGFDFQVSRLFKIVRVGNKIGLFLGVGAKAGAAKHKSYPAKFVQLGFQNPVQGLLLQYATELVGY
jgi:hypothetical protein